MKNKLAACLAFCLALPSTPACSTHESSAAVATEGALAYEVDLTRSRALDWCALDASDEVALAGTIAHLEKRVAALAPPAELRFVGDAGAGTLSVEGSEGLDSDAIERLDLYLRGIGGVEFLVLAEGDDGLDVDVAGERAKLDAFLAANPDATLAAFNAIAPSEGGPAPSVLWLPWRVNDENEDLRAVERACATHLPASLETAFTSTMFAGVELAQDAYGFPSIDIEFPPSTAEDFAEFTEARKGHRLAMVVEGEVVSAPTITAKLGSHARIEGRFSEQEITPTIALAKRGTGVLRAVR